MTLFLTITDSHHIQLVYTEENGNNHQLHLHDEINSTFSTGLIIFNTNEILILNEEISSKNSDGNDQKYQQIRFLNDFIYQPSEFPLYHITYQQCEYELLAESLLAIIIKEFINSYDKHLIIDQIILLLDDNIQLEQIAIERMYKAFDMINLPHEESESSFLKEKEELLHEVERKLQL